MPAKLIKPRPKKDNEDGSPQSKASATVKSLPGKMAKKMKRQLGRLDDMLHHVTNTKHEPKQSRSRTISSSSSSSTLSTKSVNAIKAVRAFFPSSPASSRSSRSTWTSPSKYVKEVDLHSIDRASCSSSEHLPVLPFSLVIPTTNVVMTEKHLPVSPIPEEGSASFEPMYASPPTVYVEPDTPDPFLVDDEDDSHSSIHEEQTESPATVSQSVSPSHNVPLDLPLSSSPNPDFQRPIISPVPNVNKEMPPPPSSDSEAEDEEIPDIYVPTLIVPTMFLPIPNTDPLTTLLNKYIYPPEKRPARDLTGDWQRGDFHTLVMTNSWRALARMARDRLVTAEPSDLTLILGLWHLRLSCLARLRLFNQASAECTNLFSVLNGIEPPEAREYVFERILPFELEVMQTRLKYWAGDHMGYLDALYGLLEKCRTKCRQAGADAISVPMWKERGARVSLMIASQMVEMKEITAAAKLLEPLCKQGSVTNPALRSAIARIYLQGGNLDAATKHFLIVENDPTADEAMKKANSAILAAAQGDWEVTAEKLGELVKEDANNFVAVNNLSVALLSQGKLKEGISVLENALHTSPSSVVVAEPFLFNLSTLYELQSTIGFEKKKELLIEVAKWSGDGLKTNSLKMPAN